MEYIQTTRRGERETIRSLRNEVQSNYERGVTTVPLELVLRLLIVLDDRERWLRSLGGRLG